jgi:hypothetical protein
MRGALLAFVVVVGLGAGGLVLVGTSDQRSTAFSLDVPNAKPVVTLLAGERACQRPVVAAAAFRGLELWLASVPAPGATLRVSVTSGGGAGLAVGNLHVPPGPVANPSTQLTRTVPRGATVSLCFDNAGPAPVSLLGSTPGPDSGMLEQRGRSLPSAAAAVLLQPHSSSILSLLPTIFSRAALFRPTWIGQWTYWLLLALLVAAFPLVGLALTLASRDDRTE